MTRMEIIIFKDMKQLKEKRKKRISNSKLETFGSIKLGDVEIINDIKNDDDVKCFKKCYELRDKMISFMIQFPVKLNNVSQESETNINNSENIYENKSNIVENKSDPFNVGDAFKGGEKPQNNSNSNGNNQKYKIYMKIIASLVKNFVLKIKILFL